MPRIITGPVRVLQLIHNSGITGPGRVLYGLARNLERKEFLPDVLCPDGGYLSEDLKKANVRITPFVLSNPLRPIDIFRLWNVLRKNKYHIFHTHSGQLSAFSRIMGKMLNVPVIIFTEHLSVADHAWIKGRFRLFAHLLFHRLSNAMVDRVIAVSDTARKSFIERQGISPKKIMTIYNGVDTEDSLSGENTAGDTRKRLGIHPDAPVICMISRFSPEKGHITLVSAAKEVLRKNPRVMFLLIGDGPESRHIKDLVNSLEIKENFIFAAPQRNIYQAISIADIIVQSSLDVSESFGLVVAEAMSGKKAVIVSDIGCFREIVKNEESGLLFPPGDYLKLAEKINFLLGDMQFREKIAKAGQDIVKTNFDIRTTVKKTQDLYKEALFSKGFYLRDDYLRNVIVDFLDYLRKEGSFSLRGINNCRGALERYLYFIKKRKLTAKEVMVYLQEERNFIIEQFLHFIDKDKVFMDKVCLFNIRLSKKIIRDKEVTPEDYDERVRMQALQFQIDNYYLPKDAAQKLRLDIVLSLLRPAAGEKILDAGCGVGTFAYHCARSGAFAAGIDYSGESINTARKLAGHFGLSANTEFCRWDADERIPYPAGYFDKAVAVDFIEHIDATRKRKLLPEMLRVLKPGGSIVIFTPNGLREALGSLKSQILSFMGKHAPETRLHFGLTNRFSFERLLKETGVVFSRHYFDLNRPYLARIPVLKEILSLNLLWVIKNEKI